MKKFIKYLLPAIFIILLPTIVIANLQSIISTLNITDTTGVSNKSYNIKLDWDKPGKSTRPDNQLGIQDPSGDHDLLGYNIFYRNATAREDYGPTKTTGILATAISHMYNQLPLKGGSLYSFKVSPFHDHLTTGGTKVLANYENPNNAKEVLFLTDIDVKAKGSGSNMTVTWDNVTFQGMDVFDGYTIYFMSNVAADEPININSANKKIVPLSEITKLRDGKLEYTFSDPNLKLGVVYAVKVEPMISNKVVRDSSQGVATNQVTISNKVYKLAYPTIAREYRFNEAFMSPGLNVREVGLNSLEIYWASLALSQYDIQRVEVWESDFENFKDEVLLDTLIGDNARATNTSLTDKPTKVKYYRIKIFYLIPPATNLLIMISDTAVYNPANTAFEPYSPDIVSIEDNAKKPLTLDIAWKAFLRKPFSPDELVSPITGLFLDSKLSYDIYITDNANNFDDSAFDAFPVLTESAGNLNPLPAKDENDNDISIYKQLFNYYYEKTDTGYVKHDFEENKIYYVKIIATRDETNEKSKTAYGSHYIFPIGDINNRPVSISKPPIRIKKDDFGIEVITNNSITIMWDKRWLEMFDALTEKWYPKVGVDLAGNLVFDKDADNLEALDPTRVVYLNDPQYDPGPEATETETMKNKVIAKLTSLGATNPAIMPMRLQQLKNDIQYEVNVITYEQMIANGGYDVHLNNIIQNESVWHKITPEGDTEHPESEITNLSPNTTYVIFFRPYYEDSNGKKNAYLPNFVLGTTLDNKEPLVIKPAVPVLEAVSSTDTTATVRWTYIEGLSYEIAIGEHSLTYPEGGIEFLWDAIKDKIEIKVEGDIKYAYYTFDNLFPDSQYITWIRSYINGVTGILYSAWSNPVQLKTKDMIAPEPPKGLGIASNESVKIYNTDTGKDYIPVDKDYMIIEWLKDANDKGLVLDGKDIADKAVQWLKDDNIKGSYLAKFNELIASRNYFIRAKTRLTITRDDKDAIARYYSYIVQLGFDSEFVDYVEITIPPYPESFDKGRKVKSKDSEWSKAFEVYAGKSQDEYDGDKHKEMYPLPIDDYEITYDKATGTLSYRFRSDKIDTDGNKDNLVDQRFISNLINKKVFEYKIDLSNYYNNKITTRKIEIPYTIFTAFNERKINFTVLMADATITIPYGAFNTEKVKALKDLGKGSSIILTITNNPKNLPALRNVNMTYSEFYASTPFNLKIELKTKSNTTTLDTLSANVKLAFKLSNRYLTVDKNISAYYNDDNIASWNLQTSDYDKVAGTRTIQTKKLGNYAVIARDIPPILAQDDTIESTYNVFTKINVTDLEGYNPTEQVTVTQFNNTVSAILKGKTTFAMNEQLSEEDTTALSKSQMLITGDKATKQAAVKSLVRAYEVKTKTAIKNYATISTDSLKNVDKTYVVAFQKALKVELIDDVYDAPTDIITFSELIYMLNLILE